MAPTRWISLWTTSSRLSRNSKLAFGYNVLEFNTNAGPTTGYFDDASFSTIPEPASVFLLVAGIAMLWTRRHYAHLLISECVLAPTVPAISPGLFLLRTAC